MVTLTAVKQFSDRVDRIEISATMAVVAEAAKLKASGADLVEFGAGEPHFSTPQHIKDAAIAAIQKDCTRYTAVGGIQELRTAIARRHAADFGSMYHPNDCMVSTGGKLALFNSIQQLLIVGSLPKTYATTGWRLGYALAPAPIINAMTKLQSQSTSSTAHMVQMAALAAVTGPQDCVEKMKKDYVLLRELILGHLKLIPGVTCVKPEGAFYVYPNVSAYFGKSGIKSAADVANRLLHEAHVVTVPGEAFGTRDHIRLSYATSPMEIERGLERMQEWFGKL